jgi:hypothetical protein
MVMVKNNSPGTRVFNVVDPDAPKDRPRTNPVSLEPGQARELDLANMDSKVLQAWVESGEVILDAGEEETGTVIGEAPPSAKGSPGEGVVPGDPNNERQPGTANNPQSATTRTAGGQEKALEDMTVKELRDYITANGEEPAFERKADLLEQATEIRDRDQG